VTAHHRRGKETTMNRILLGLVGAAALISGCQSAGTREPEQAGAFSIQEFKSHHAEIKVHLGHLDEMAQELPRQAPEKQRETMRFVAKFLNDHILAHAAEEEATLYPRADAKAGPRFTASMRYEHKVITGWVRELENMASTAEPDVPLFVRRTQRVLGLLEAHFGAEEDVIAPAVAG
jgi:hemerythrin-like domain-containing protein